MQIQTELYIPLEDLTSEYDFREKDQKGDYPYLLGEGSFGQVFKAKHKNYGEVAVKVAGPGFK